jgi:hypothetical protein
MSVDVDIAEALHAQLISPALTGSPPIARPLVPYTPTPGTLYLAEHPVMRAAPEHSGLSFTDSTMYRGIFQVDVVTPDDAGELPGLRMAALVAARFAIGTELAAGNRRLRLLSVPKIATAVKDAPWIRFPVSIPYLVIA